MSAIAAPSRMSARSSADLIMRMPIVASPASTSSASGKAAASFVRAAQVMWSSSMPIRARPGHSERAATKKLSRCQSV